MPSLKMCAMSSPSSSSSSTLLCLCLLSAMALGQQPVSADAKFLLSCRVIAGICQGDDRCLDEMSVRFPDCYLESPFDLFPSKANEALLAVQVPAAGMAEQQRPLNSQQMLEKRTSVKLMKLLMMKDRIPVGRR